MNSAARTYTVQMLGACVLYSIILLAVNLLYENYEFATPARIGLALLPVMPAVLALWIVIRFVRRMDEVQARIVTESMLISAIVVGFASFTYGFIQSVVALPEISLIWVLPALVGMQGFASFFVRMRFR